jgi:hypothetical protein
VIRFTGPQVQLDEDNICLVGEQLLALAGGSSPPGWWWTSAT